MNMFARILAKVTTFPLKKSNWSVVSLDSPNLAGVVQIFMQEVDLTCSICCQLARDALECEQLKCRKLFCRACHTHILSQTANTEQPPKCPFCRIPQFQVRESPLRETINNKLLKCQHCLKLHKFKLITKHQTECDYKKVECRICSRSLNRNDIVAHTKLSHKQKVDGIILHSQIYRYPVLDPEAVIKGLKEEERPHLGFTGKFYCGGDLGLPGCNCCNGKCGPTNGQNCCRCMELDMVRRGLPRGYLVHANGDVCWLDGYQHFHCRVMYSGLEKTCGKEGYCKWCRNIQITAGRYEALMQ